MHRIDRLTPSALLLLAPTHTDTASQQAIEIGGLSIIMSSSTCSSAATAPTSSPCRLLLLVAALALALASLTTSAQAFVVPPSSSSLPLAAAASARRSRPQQAVRMMAVEGPEGAWASASTVMVRVCVRVCVCHTINRLRDGSVAPIVPVTNQPHSFPRLGPPRWRHPS